jgi:hypothetical protein
MLPYEYRKQQLEDKAQQMQKQEEQFLRSLQMEARESLMSKLQEN